MKYFFIPVFTLLFSISLLAQQDRKKIESLRIAYITDELDLTTEEAQKFWPVFNDFEKNKIELRQSKNGLMASSSKSSSDKLTEYLAIEESEYVLLEKYITELRAIISDEKIILLLSSEKRFKERSFQNPCEICQFYFHNTTISLENSRFYISLCLYCRQSTKKGQMEKVGKGFGGRVRSFLPELWYIS